MTTQHSGGDPAAAGRQGQVAGACCNRAQLMAATRALLIAVALLGALAVIVLF